MEKTTKTNTTARTTNTTRRKTTNTLRRRRRARMRRRVNTIRIVLPLLGGAGFGAGCVRLKERPLPMLGRATEPQAILRRTMEPSMTMSTTSTADTTTSTEGTTTRSGITTTTITAGATGTSTECTSTSTAATTTRLGGTTMRRAITTRQGRAMSTRITTTPATVKSMSRSSRRCSSCPNSAETCRSSAETSPNSAQTVNRSLLMGEICHRHRLLGLETCSLAEACRSLAGACRSWGERACRRLEELLQPGEPHAAFRRRRFHKSRLLCRLGRPPRCRSKRICGRVEHGRKPRKTRCCSSNSRMKWRSKGPPIWGSKKATKKKRLREKMATARARCIAIWAPRLVSTRPQARRQTPST
mmetsp:Transcript_16412/g.40547  ORF Transcript_16412/g.40547 Transcript_16412/m.40547 type:complete len:358 (+) Transcript_16412:1041-2114(+)